MDECFDLLECATSADIPFMKTKIYPYDPLESLADNLETKMKAAGFRILISSQSCNQPSTSADSIAKDSTFDSRIRYSNLVTELFSTICNHIKNCKVDDSSIVLSVKKLNNISSALQFFIATAVLPYLDEGVGTPMELRSNLIQFWKPLRNDSEFRIKQLISAANTFFLLLESCDSVKMLIINKFLCDVICVNEQLIELNEMSLLNKYEEFLTNEVFRPILIRAFFTVINGYSLKQKRIDSPNWLKRSLSGKLSKLCAKPNGIYHLATSLIQDNFDLFDNFAFVHSLARVILTRPRNVKNYYANILKQFMKVMQYHPSAERLSVWFAVTVDIAAEFASHTVTVHIFDILLHPWEALLHRLFNDFDREDFWNSQLDCSLKVLSIYFAKMPPGLKYREKSRLEKLFCLWLTLYGKGKNSLRIIETDNIALKEKYGKFINTIEKILKYVLIHHSTDYKEQAEFIIDQILNKNSLCELLLVEFNCKKLIVEVSDCDVGNQSLNPSFDYVILKRITSETAGQNFNLDFRLKTVIELVQRLENSHYQTLIFNLLILCVKEWRVNSIDELEPDTNRFVVQESEVINNATRKMSMQYIMGQLYSFLPDIDDESEENIASMVAFAQAIFDSTNNKLSAFSPMQLDVFAEDSSDELTETERNSIKMAMAIIGGTCISLHSSKLRNAVVPLSESLNIFCHLVEQIDIKRKTKYAELYDNAKQLLDYFCSTGIHLNISSPFTFDKNNEKAKNLMIWKNVDDLAEIFENLKDSSEAIRGHALIILARDVRLRKRVTLTAVESNSQIMKLIMKNVTDNDSYVYLAAIGAMAELAYWKDYFFNEMVEFFVDPCDKLRDIIDQDFDKDDDKEVFLLIQRVKVGEALGKVCRALGDMAPWYYDRLIDPLLSLIAHVDDEHLRASAICSLADLIKACRGRKIEKNIDELLILIERILFGAKEAILRRSAISLLRAIIISYDNSIFQNLSSYLRDINRELRKLLMSDKDDGVRLLAELCLTDLKEQFKNCLLDIESIHCRRINI